MKFYIIYDALEEESQKLTENQKRILVFCIFLFIVILGYSDELSCVDLTLIIFLAILCAFLLGYAIALKKSVFYF